MKKKLIFENGSVIIPELGPGFEKIKNKMIVRLEHVSTNKYLHSHDVRPGWNDDKEINEVTGYGDKDFSGDANDHWIIETLDGSEDILAMKSRIRLRHPQTGCYLMSRDSKLPKWGFGQQEVTCSRQALKSLAVWRIEWTDHDASNRVFS